MSQEHELIVWTSHPATNTVYFLDFRIKSFRPFSLKYKGSSLGIKQYKLLTNDIFKNIYICNFSVWGTRWCSLLRHCPTSWKVTGSIPNGVTGIFHCIYLPATHYGPGVDSASNRNEYRPYFLGGKCSRCVGLTTLPPSCADRLEIWEPQPPGIFRAFPRLYSDTSANEWLC